MATSRQLPGSAYVVETSRNARQIPGGAFVFSVEHPIYTAPSAPDWSKATPRDTMPLERAVSALTVVLFGIVTWPVVNRWPASLTSHPRDGGSGCSTRSR